MEVPVATRRAPLPFRQNPACGANTLIVIYATHGRLNPNEDCCLAAENLMPAAYEMGLSPGNEARTRRARTLQRGISRRGWISGRIDGIPTLAMSPTS